MKKSIFALVFTMFFYIVGCSSDEPADGAVTVETKKGISLSRSESEIAKQNSRFGIELLKAVNNCADENGFVVSPFSISSAYSILANGVTGIAQSEIIDNVSGRGASIDNINSFNGKILAELPSLDGKVTFTAINALCSNAQTKFNQSFSRISTGVYKSECFEADLRTQEGIDVVNNWSSKHTNGLIAKLLDKPIDSDFGILNATYFKGAFQKKFDKSKTTYRDFTSESGQTHSVPTMYALQNVRFYESEKMTVMQLPFGTGAYRLNIILPGRLNSPSNTSVTALVASLSSAEWSEAVVGMTPLNANVYLPKFSLDYKTNIIDVLKSMGIRQVFETTIYNTGVLEGGEAKINYTPTATRFSLDEEGAEAAAATIVAGQDISNMPMDIRINRSFAFIVDEASTGVILFAGIMRDI